MNALRHGLGNFRLVFKVDLQKKGCRLIITASMNVLSHCLANIKGDTCLWIFDVDGGNF